ncbi:hypothetical protein Taro_049465 [Colocasia esculenta]|uniref:Uncharacterized protein n=1 Tax=Colocasia esculenta TaxID=4460 RepID=A0A843XAY9_COLES|nr:hypothetical protein [Colocasia esculenta]
MHTISEKQLPTCHHQTVHIIYQILACVPETISAPQMIPREEPPTPCKDYQSHRARRGELAPRTVENAELCDTGHAHENLKRLQQNPRARLYKCRDADSFYKPKPAAELTDQTFMLLHSTPLVVLSGLINDIYSKNATSSILVQPHN